MAEYILTPEKTEQPSGLELMEELHRRGFPVEIHLTGQDKQWEAIRFTEPGPPEVECLLSYGSEGYIISISQDAPPSASDLQTSLVETLLQDLGGQVDNVNTRERFTPEEFTAKLKHQQDSAAPAKERFWIVFSWAVVVMALGIYFVISPDKRDLVVVILVLSFLSAALQTYSHAKT